MGRAKLGNGTTGDRHGEGLAGLGPTEHLADVVTQLLLCDVAHAGQGSRTATLASFESAKLRRSDRPGGLVHEYQLAS